MSTKIGSDGERVNWLASPRSAPSKRWHDAAFIAHAREDLPAALAWGEQMRTERDAARFDLAAANKLVATWAANITDASDELARRKVEIERLTAELAARAPAARPEVDAEDLWTDYRTERGIVTSTDRGYFLAGVAAGRRTADASRPGLTEEQADAIALGCLQVREDLQRHAIKRAILRASRGETFEVRHPDGTRDRVEPHDPRATLHAGDPASPFAPGSLAAGSATEDRILDRKRGGK